MELKRYNQKIRDQLMGDVHAQVHKENQMCNGTYRAGSFAQRGKQLDDQYDELIRRLQTYHGPKISLKNHIDSGYDCHPASYIDVHPHDDLGGSIRKKKAYKKHKDDSSDDDSDGMRGGKFNFIKALSHVGKEVVHVGKAVGSDAFNDVKKAATIVAKSQLDKQAAKAINYGTKTFMSTATAALPEVAEEAAPLALAAAGMKRTRKISAKEANRHALIRKLMQKHHCTMAEASKHIKENNIPY